MDATAYHAHTADDQRRTRGADELDHVLYHGIADDLTGNTVNEILLITNDRAIVAAAILANNFLILFSRTEHCLFLFTMGERDNPLPLWIDYCPWSSS